MTQDCAGLLRDEHFERSVGPVFVPTQTAAVAAAAPLPLPVLVPVAILAPVAVPVAAAVAVLRGGCVRPTLKLWRIYVVALLLQKKIRSTSPRATLLTRCRFSQGMVMNVEK